jgi:Protein of unknown function (DUF3619)
MTIKQSNASTLDALQGRIALRIASGLTERAEQIPHDIGERLRVARELAVERARLVRHAATSSMVQVQSGGSAVLAGPPSMWVRFASVLPLVVLVGGLVVIQKLHDREQISAAAEIDAALLADDLPPAAYQDPGFAAFLQTPSEP